MSKGTYLCRWWTPQQCSPNNWYPQHKENVDNYIEFGGAARNLGVNFLLSRNMKGETPHMWVLGNTASAAGKIWLYRKSTLHVDHAYQFPLQCLKNYQSSLFLKLLDSHQQIKQPQSDYAFFKWNVQLKLVCFFFWSLKIHVPWAKALQLLNLIWFGFLFVSIWFKTVSSVFQLFLLTLCLAVITCSKPVHM